MIEIKNLSFSYGREALFSGLDLSATPGNIYGLLGKNGAGKTTLMKLLCGMLFPKEGECYIMGQRPRDRSPLFLQELFIVPEAFNMPPVNMKKYEKLYAPFYRGSTRPDITNTWRCLNWIPGKRSMPFPMAKKRRPFWHLPLPPAADSCSWMSRPTAWIFLQRAAFENSWHPSWPRTACSSSPATRCGIWRI